MTFFLTHKETHDDKIVGYNNKFGSSSLSEPTSSQKEKTTGNCNLIIMKPVDTC
jgi:hypothetical protein